MNQKIIVARDREHLKELIKEHIDKYGQECDLNHIDVSNVTDMNSMFQDSQFNGAISNWNVSNVTNMRDMFYGSKFNGDISNWNASNVNHMGRMFSRSIFNKDLSKWNVSNVKDMFGVFYESKFNGDLSKWDVSNVKNMEYMFSGSKFNGDISKWNINEQCDVNRMFSDAKYPDDGILYWYFALNGAIYDMAEDRAAHLEKLKPIFENFELEGIRAARHLHQTFTNGNQVQDIANYQFTA